MKPPLVDILRHLVSAPGSLEVGLLAILVLVAAGAVAFLVALRRTGGALGAEGPAAEAAWKRLRRWPRLLVRLGLLATLLAVLHLAARHVALYRELARFGPNVTPMDVTNPRIETFLGFGAGVAVGVLGLAAGWILDWILEGRRIAALRAAAERGES